MEERGYSYILKIIIVGYSWGIFYSILCIHEEHVTGLACNTEHTMPHAVHNSQQIEFYIKSFFSVSMEQ